MACFLVPLAEAVAISAAKGIYSKKTEKDAARGIIKSSGKKLKIQNFLKKVDILQNMLYGGTFLLAVDHVFSGELTWRAPFLTALKTPADTQIMLHEIATVGVAMSVSITVLWAAWAAIKTFAKSPKKDFSRAEN